MRRSKLSEIAKAIEGKFIGKEDPIITGIAGVEEAQNGDLVFLANMKYKKYLYKTKASGAIVPPELEGSIDIPAIICEKPSLGFARAVEYLGLSRKKPSIKISKYANISENAQISSNVGIGAFTVIEDGASIGDGTIIYPHVYIGYNVKIGKNCIIYPSVVIMDGTIIGNNVIINAGSVIGSDGFGFELEKNHTTKIPQVGIVVIEDDVEIGANVSIDRARFSKTIIGRGTKIDNLVQIAHNVKIGNNCVIVAQTGIAGSTQLKDNVILAGQTGVVGHLKIENNVITAAKSGVTKSIKKPGIYGGIPARPIGEWRKEVALLRHIEEIKKEVKMLRERVKRLEEDKTKNNSK